MTDTNADYEDAKRGLMMTDNREVIIIQDEIKANKLSEFYWFANTKAEITIAEDGKSGELHYTNAQGDKVLPFGINHNVFGKFPQAGYSADHGVTPGPEGFYYDCAASAVSCEPQKLNLKVQYYYGIRIQHFL